MKRKTKEGRKEERGGGGEEGEGSVLASSLGEQDRPRITTTQHARATHVIHHHHHHRHLVNRPAVGSSHGRAAHLRPAQQAARGAPWLGCRRGGEKGEKKCAPPAARGCVRRARVPVSSRGLGTWTGGQVARIWTRTCLHIQWHARGRRAAGGGRLAGWRHEQRRRRVVGQRWPRRPRGNNKKKMMMMKEEERRRRRRK